MSNFYFKEERRRRKVGNRIITYDIISYWEYPAMDFPTEAAAAQWGSNLAFFESEMTRYDDLEISILDTGRTMYFCDYTFELADWLYQSALDLGATVDGGFPGTNSPDPFMAEDTAPMEQGQPAMDLQQHAERANEKTKQAGEAATQQTVNESKEFVKQIESI